MRERVFCFALLLAGFVLSAGYGLTFSKKGDLSGYRNGADKRYNLSVSVPDASVYEAEDAVYIKDGTVLNISYSSAEAPWSMESSGDGQGGGQGGVCRTQLFINGKEKSAGSFTYTVGGTTIIKLKFTGGSGGSSMPWTSIDSTVWSKTFTVDSTGPSAAVSAVTKSGAAYTEGAWVDEPVILTFSGDDTGGCGVAAYVVESLSEPVYVPAYTVNTTQNVKVRAVDNIGNEGAWTSFRVNIDRTPPVITFDADGYEAGTWVQNPVTVRVHAEDDNKVESVVLYADGNVSTGVFSVAAGSAGIYDVSAAAVDQSGKGSSKTFGSVKIDRKAPVIGTVGLAFEAPADGSLMQYLAVSDTVSDAEVNSGLTEITVQYRTGSGSFMTAEQTALPSVSVYDCSCRIPLDGIDRSSDKTVYVQFTAEDAAGNSSVRTASILLPAAINASAGAADSRVDGSLIKTKITLGAIHPGSYGAVRYRRTFLAGNVGITEDNFNTYFQENERSVWRNLTGMQTLSAAQLVSSENDGVRTYCFEDTIASDSGFGHKNIRYTFYETPRNCSFTECNGGPASFLLADNKGIIAWKITGRDGKELILGADGSESRRDTDFVLPANGMVYFGFRVKDYDMEPYRLALKQVTGVASGSGGNYLLRQQVEGAVSTGATGYNKPGK